ncbi:MAG TPA: hypothetical protein VFB31_11770 [Pseudolabrys sp.]|nr:hypothetical protein [Pseudolabrys sp.]
MAGVETIERLRNYLRELSPQARSLLIGEFERSLLRGDEASGIDLVLQELRRIVRDQRENAPRIGHCARLFFKPIEPYIVDDRADHGHPGRVARCSLEMLWTWLRRDLLPEQAKALADGINEALLAGDEPKAQHMMRAFQDKAAAAIGAVLAESANDDKIRRRVTAQIGTPRPIDDATTLKCVLAGRRALDMLAAHLPLRISNLAGGELDEYKALIEKTSARDGELFLYALLAVMNRLAAPWQIIRFGVRAAGSDTAARVAESHYGVTVTIALAELERMVAELREDLRSGAGVAVGALLKAIHDAARGLRTELDLPVDSTWGRALAAQRAQIAEMLRAEIESAPGRMRRLLRARPSSEIRANSALDADEVAEIEALIGFVGNCRSFASELAINEMTQRTFSEIQQYLDSGTRALLDGLRHAGDIDRSFRQSQVDAAVRFCAKVFGADYAALLTKAAEVAGAAERKAKAG